MAVKRKISIRKVLQVLLTIVMTTGCIMAMVSASTIEDSKTVKSVSVHIYNDRKYHFIQEREIVDLAINRRNVNLAKTPLSRLDIKTMERVISADRWVANAQVFVDKSNILQMYITQRIPVARFFQQNGDSYYMDTTLNFMPLSQNNIYYTTVVTNVPEVKNDSIAMAMRKDILSLVRTIQEDTFWNAQISQVIVDSVGMFELVPMLGDHRILFGDATEMKEKLDNLFAFYKNVLNRIGWDKYQVLDLRFNGQVVASPSLPYKGPVDKPVVTMNWINSIVETEARNDSVRNAGSGGRSHRIVPAPAKPVKPIVVQLKHPSKVAPAAAPKKDAKKPDPKNNAKKKAEDKKKADLKKKEDDKKKAANKKVTGAKPADKSKDKNKQNNKQQTKANDSQPVKKVH